MNIGERIKQLRKFKNYNQLEFAEIIGIKQTALSLIETGKNAVTEQCIKVICLSLSVNEKWLRFGEGEMFASEKEKTVEERRFIELYEKLNPIMKDAALKQLESLVNAQNIQENKEKEDDN